VKLFSACSVVVAAILVSGCGFVRPYVPAQGTLLAKKGVHKLWEGSEGFFVVSTWQMADPRNEVCIFKTREAAEDYYLESLTGASMGRSCGRGRVHCADTYRTRVDCATRKSLREKAAADKPPEAADASRDGETGR